MPATRALQALSYWQRDNQRTSKKNSNLTFQVKSRNQAAVTYFIHNVEYLCLRFRLSFIFIDMR